MNIEELARQVTRMRDAQRRFFRTRRPSDMEESKRLEKQVDQACKEALEQPSLFGSD